MDNLRILLSASLNPGKSIGDLNQAIQAISKHPNLQKIKVKIDIDTSTMSQFISAVNKIKKISDEQNRVIQENVEITKKMNGTTQQVTQSVLENGRVITKTKIIHDENRKAMQDETIAAKKLADGIDKLNKTELDSIQINKNKANNIAGYTVRSSEGYTTTTKRLESDGQTLINSSSVTNYKKQREDLIREQKRLNKEAERLDRDHFNAIRDNNKRTEDMEKLHYLALQKNRQRDLDHQQAVARQQIKIDDIRRRYGTDASISNSLNSLSSSLGNINAVGDYKRALSDIDLQLKNIATTAKTATSHTMGFGEALKTAFIKFPVWLISGTIFVNATRFFTEGISYVNELNSALTQISIVTGKNQKEVSDLGKEYNQLAKEMGVTTKQIAESSVEFYRQGLSQTEVMERVRVNTQYAKISNLEFKESAEILTATVNSMGVSIERASDVFSYLGDATATGADEIGKAFQRVGGSAGALNIEFEKVSSWIAVLSSRTREGAGTIGNSIKSILARVQNLTETGFDEEDGTTINQVAKALNAVGIQLTDASGQFRNFGDVLDELGGKWDTLNTREKAYLSTTVAGTYQQARFLNLMEGYKDTIPLYEKALESAGVTTEKFSLYQEGTQASIDKLKASMEGLWQSSFESGGLKSAADILASIITLADKIVSSIGFIPVVFGAVGASAVLLSSNFRASITSGSILTSTFTGLTVSSRALTVALRGLVASTGVGLAFVALGFIIEKLIGNVFDLTKESKSLTDEFKSSTKETNNKIDELKKLSVEYDSLSSRTNKTKEELEKLHQIEKDLVSIYGVSISGINSQGEAYANNTESINQRIKALERQNELEKDTFKNKVYEKHAEDSKAISEEIKNVENYRKRIRELQDVINGIQNVLENGGKVKLLSGIEYDESDSEQLQKILKTYTGYLSQAEAKFANSITNLNEQTKDRITVAINEFEKQVIKNGAEISDKGKAAIYELIKVNAEIEGVTLDRLIEFAKEQAVPTKWTELLLQYEKLTAEYSKDQSETVKNQLQQTTGKIIKEIDAWNAALNSSTTSTERSKEVLGDFLVDFRTLFTDVGKTQKATINLDSINKQLSKSYNDTASAIQPLNDAIDKMNQGKSLTSNEITKLLEKYPDLINAFTEENGLLKIGTAALESKRDAEIDGFNTAISTTQKSVDAQRTALSSKLTMYSAEIAAIKNAAEAKSLELKVWQDATKQYNQEGLTGPGFVPIDVSQTINAIGAAQEVIDGMKKVAESGFKFENSINTPNSSSRDKQDTQATLHTLTDFSKEEIDNINNVISARENLIKSLERQINTAKKADDYNQQLNLTNQLLEQQKGKIDDINTANTLLSDKANNVRDTYAKLSQQFSENGVGFDQWFNDDATASETYIKTIQDIDRQMQKVEGNGLNLSDTQKVQIKNLENQKSQYEEIFKQLQSIKQAWSGNAEEIIKVTDLIDGINENLKQMAEERRKAEFETSEKWISAETDRMLIAGKSEIEIAQMVLNARLRMADERWAKERQITALTAEEQLKADKDVYDARKRLEDLVRDNQKKTNDNAKDLIKKISDAQKDYYDALLDAEDKLHKKRMDNLDDEMDKYEESINTIKKSMQREDEEDTFNKDLAKLQKEAQDILSKRNKYELDNSREGKLAKSELDKEYAEKLEQIEKLQTDRTKQLRTNNLDDMLDKKKKEIDEAKDKETKIYEDLKESLKNQKQAVENHWNEVLNSEEKFAEFRNNMLAGKFSELVSEMEGFKDDIINISKLIGEAFADNVGGSIQSSIDAIKNYSKNPTGDSSNNFRPSPSTSNPSTSTGGFYSPKDDNEKRIIDIMKSNSSLWNESDEEKRKQLHQSNQGWADSIKATYKNGTWYKNNMPLYHDGGVVGVEGTSQKSWMDKILNGNEIHAILKRSEVVLSNPMKFINELGQNAMKNVAGIINNKSTSNNSSNKVEINLNYYGNITKEQSRTSGQIAIGEMKKLGLQV